MIIVFLIVLIMALIIANFLVSTIRPKTSYTNYELGLSNPAYEIIEEPEVIQTIGDLKENTSLMQGAINATARKLDMINERINNLEKVVMELVEKKIKEPTENEQKNQS